MENYKTDFWLTHTFKAKYIIIGDYYQLPSVSQGQVLKDLIDSECLDVIKLNKLVPVAL